MEDPWHEFIQSQSLECIPVYENAIDLGRKSINKCFGDSYVMYMQTLGKKRKIMNNTITKRHDLACILIRRHILSIGMKMYF